jgi:hypothetical protein
MKDKKMIMNSKIGGMKNKVVMTYCKVLSQNSPGRSDEISERSVYRKLVLVTIITGIP